MAKEDMNKEIDEIKKLLDDTPPEESQAYSVEDILADFKYATTISSSRARTADPEVLPGERRPEPIHVQEQAVQPEEAEEKPEPEAPTYKPQGKPSADAGGRSTLIEEERDGQDPTQIEQELAAFEQQKTEVSRKKFDLIFGGGEQDDEEELAKPERMAAPAWWTRLRKPPDLPKPMPVKDALRLNEKRARSMGWRTFAAFLLCAALAYLSLAHKTGWPLPEALSYVRSPYIYLLTVSFLQLSVMLLGYDLIGKGLRDISRLTLGLESLVTVNALAAVIYVLGIVIRPELGGYLPYCSVAALGMFLCMFGTYLRLSALRWSMKLASGVAKPYAVVREPEIWEMRSAYIKHTPESTDAFTVQSLLPDCSEKFMRFFAPITIAAAFVFALLAARSESVRFLWAFSAILSPAAGAFALSFSLPCFIAARKLVPVGAAIAGWTAACSLSDDSVMVLTDRDIFPPGTVTLNGMKVFNNYPTDMVIACAASMMEASGSGLARVFGELVHSYGDALRRAEKFEHYEGGGMGAEIMGNAVLMGTQNFMLRMGVRLPQGVGIKDAVYLSVNHELAGVFAVRYAVQPGVRDALSALTRKRITQIFAVRDFNITPAMLGDKLGQDTEYAEFPVVEERLDLSRSDWEYSAPPVALLAREGLTPFAECVLTARRLHRVAKLNLALSAVGAILGVLLMYYLAYTGSFSAASPGNLLIYNALWSVPAVVLSGWVGGAN